MLANLNIFVIYCRSLNKGNVGTVVNYWSIFITSAPGACTIKLFTAVIVAVS